MKPEKMIRSILWWMFLGVILLFILVWVLSGGPQQVWGRAGDWSKLYSRTNATQTENAPGGIWNMFTGPDSGQMFKLPWQPALPQGTINANPDEYFAADDKAPITEPNTPATHTTALQIEQVSPNENPSLEYIQFSALDTATLDGWTLQNSQGLQLPFPLATGNNSGDTIPFQEVVSVNAGDRILLITGAPPTGTSFKEGGTWNLFVGSPSPLWGVLHDTIQLLDTNGVVVDTFTY
jgi:hypothetical protein